MILQGTIKLEIQGESTNFVINGWPDGSGNESARFCETWNFGPRRQISRWIVSRLTEEGLRVAGLVGHRYEALSDGNGSDDTVGGRIFIEPDVQRKGTRYDDPAIGIRWPFPVSAISVKDETGPWWCNEWAIGNSM